MQAIVHNQERVQQVQQSYCTTEAQSRESDFGLLLPSVSSTPHPQVHANGTTEQTVIASDIQQLEDERDIWHYVMH